MQHLFIHYIETNVGTCSFQQVIFLAKIRSNDVGIPVDFAKTEGKLHSYLSRGTDDKYLFFYHSSNSISANVMSNIYTCPAAIRFQVYSFWLMVGVVYSSKPPIDTGCW